jgi:hypothetical protein
MAFRIGSRKDQSPVVLEIMARQAVSKGVSFYGFGSLFLSSHVPSQFIAGPKVAKEILERRQASAESKKKSESEYYDIAPGSLILDMNMEPVKDRRGRGRKRKGWKEAARKSRRSR